jgi:hypothetical protein
MREEIGRLRAEVERLEGELAGRGGGGAKICVRDRGVDTMDGGKSVASKGVDTAQLGDGGCCGLQ